YSRLYDFVMATNDQAVTMMQIGEIAKRTCLTVDAIRFYEKRKLMPKADRSAGRFRLYTEGTVERLQFIRQMQGLGFSLYEVGELIQFRERKIEACESVRQLLTAKLANVRAKLHELKRADKQRGSSQKPAVPRLTDHPHRRRGCRTTRDGCSQPCLSAVCKSQRRSLRRVAAY